MDRLIVDSSINNNKKIELSQLFKQFFQFFVHKHKEINDLLANEKDNLKIVYLKDIKNCYETLRNGILHTIENVLLLIKSNDAINYQTYIINYAFEILKPFSYELGINEKLEEKFKFIDEYDEISKNKICKYINIILNINIKYDINEEDNKQYKYHRFYKLCLDVYYDYRYLNVDQAVNLCQSKNFAFYMNKSVLDDMRNECNNAKLDLLLSDVEEYNSNKYLSNINS